MKAVVYDKNNASGVLVYRDVEKPAPADDEVLVKVYRVGNPLSTYKNALTPKGACILIGGALSQIFKAMVLGPLLSAGGKKIKVLSARPSAEDLNFIIGLIAEGRIKPVIDRRYPLREVAEAMRYLSAGHSQGKVVLEVAEN